jgi:hypothetical protein
MISLEHLYINFGEQKSTTAGLREGRVPGFIQPRTCSMRSQVVTKCTSRDTHPVDRTLGMSGMAPEAMSRFDITILAAAKWWAGITSSYAFGIGPRSVLTISSTVYTFSGRPGHGPCS